MKILMSIMLATVIVLLSACAKAPEPVVKPTIPAKVTPVKVEWKVVADVREINGVKYLVTPYTGQPYVALTYPDSLRLRSWLNDIKRNKDQTDNILCFYGYVEKCKNGNEATRTNKNQGN